MEKGSATDSAVTRTHSLHSCAADAGQLFSLLIKQRIGHLPWGCSLDATITYPQQTFRAAQPHRFPHGLEKQILSFPPAKWLLVFFVLKKKKRNSPSSAE